MLQKFIVFVLHKTVEYILKDKTNITYNWGKFY